MSGKVVGVDMGGVTARIVQGRASKGVFQVDRAATVGVDDVGATLREMGAKGAAVYVGVTGRDMILRTTQVPPVPDWQLRELMQFEIEDVAEQSGDELSADFALLGGAAAFTDEDMVLLALVRNSLIEERTAQLGADGIKVAAFSPNAVALHNACVAADGGAGTVMVAHLGGAHTDIALVCDGELLFARNLSGGGDLFTAAIQDTFKADAAKAEAVKRKIGALARPGERLTGQQGAVARALEGGLRQVTGMLQSSILLCRNQLKAKDLKVERVLLCGPGASLPGLDEALSRSLDLPVQRFDPSEGYVVGDEVGDIDERGADYAVATGLAMMGALADAYRIEILSDAARKARRFRQKTVWLVAAAVLVVAHLVLYALSTKSAYTAAQADLVKLRREVESREADTRAYERHAAEASVAAEHLDELEQLTAPGAGALTVLALLERHLPDELWITSLRSVREIEPEFGHGDQRRPFVIVEGRGKEISRSLSSAVTELTERLRHDDSVAGAVPQFTTDNRGDFSWTLKIDTSLFPADAAEDDADDDDTVAAGPPPPPTPTRDLFAAHAPGAGPRGAR